MQLIIPFLAALLIYFPVRAHPFHSLNATSDHHRLFKREEGQIVCGGQADAALLERSISELKLMLPRAISSLDLVNNWLTATASDTKADGATWAAVQYFEVIFGGPLQIYTRTQVAASQARVTYVKGKLTLVSNMLTSADAYPFNLYCTDGWLSGPADEATHGLSAGQRIDMRAGAAQAAALQRLSGVSGAFTTRKCGTVSDVIAWVTPQPPLFDQPLMTLCPAHLTKYDNYADAGFSLSQLLDLDINAVTLPGRNAAARNHIRALVTRSLATTLMHEIAHVTPVMFPGQTGQSTILDLSEGFTYEGQPTCTSGYGWHCITLLARNDQAKPLLNADTWAYYVLGASLSKNNWSTGFPEPLVAQP